MADTAGRYLSPRQFAAQRQISHGKVLQWIHAGKLRAINVAGKRMVPMADLRAMIESLGFKARTLLQSGNIVLGGRGSGAKLEALLESETEKRLGLKTEYLVRSSVEWDDLVANNPFPAEAKADPGHLVVLALNVRDQPSDQGDLLLRNIRRQRHARAIVELDEKPGQRSVLDEVVELMIVDATARQRFLPPPLCREQPWPEQIHRVHRPRVIDVVGGHKRGVERARA